MGEFTYPGRKMQIEATSGGLGKGPDYFLPPASKSPPVIHIPRQSGDEHHLLQGEKGLGN